MPSPDEKYAGIYLHSRDQIRKVVQLNYRPHELELIRTYTAMRKGGTPIHFSWEFNEQGLITRVQCNRWTEDKRRESYVLIETSLEVSGTILAGARYECPPHEIMKKIEPSFSTLSPERQVERIVTKGHRWAYLINKSLETGQGLVEFREKSKDHDPPQPLVAMQRSEGLVILSRAAKRAEEVELRENMQVLKGLSARFTDELLDITYDA